MPRLQQRKEFTTLIVKLIEEHRLTELKQIIEENDQALPETAIRIGYRTFIDREMSFRTRFFMIKKLYEITQIQPEENILVALIRSTIGTQPLAVIKLVIEQLAIKPTALKSLNRDIQEWFQTMLDNNQFTQVVQLSAILGIGPEPTLIQENYKLYLISGRFVSYTGLSKQLDIPPQPATIQQVYHHFHLALAPGSPIPHQDRENVQKWYSRIETITGFADPNPLSPA